MTWKPSFDMRVPPSADSGGAGGSIEETDLTARLVILIVAATVTGGGHIIGSMHPLTPLAAAAPTGDLEEIDCLVAAGADIDAGGGVSTWPPLLPFTWTRSRPRRACSRTAHRSQVSPASTP